jgi:peptidoglycan/LPS O-acetylase OafA/YrhL
VRFWYTAHFWSLSMEEHFYLLWPALLAALGARGALIAAGVLVTADALWRPWSLAHIYLPYPALQRTDMRLDAFLCAGLLAILLQDPCRVPVLRVLTAAWFRARSGLAVMAAWIWMLTGSAPSAGTLAEGTPLPAILASVIYWQGSRLFHFSNGCPFVDGPNFLRPYLWHQLFFTPQPAITFSIAAEAFLPRVALTFAAAIATYYLLERPLMDHGRAVSNRCQRPSPAILSEAIPSSIMEQ